MPEFHSFNSVYKINTHLESVTLVCLPSGPKESPPPKTRALFSGWGTNENYTATDELKYQWVHIISLDECKERGAEPTETNLCTYDKTTFTDGRITGHPVGAGHIHVNAQKFLLVVGMVLLLFKKLTIYRQSQNNFFSISVSKIRSVNPNLISTDFCVS